MGDIVGSAIRDQQTWDLMPDEALFTCVLPSFQMHQSSKVHVKVDFPQFLGKCSTTNKNKRLLQTLKTSLSLDNSADVLQRLPLIHHYLAEPMRQEPQNFQECIGRLSEFNLTKEDWDYIRELLAAFDVDKAYELQLDTKTKAVLTRKYNASHAKMKSIETTADEKEET